MDKLLIICGPTATGKTSLGISLAKKFAAEIISADSRQVYRGMTIGTGKDIENVKCQMSNVKSISNDKFQIGYYGVDGIKIWLLDIVEPDYRFNVADYKKCADVVIKDILSREKLPIIVGGTGFYIRAVVDGIETMGIPPDWELRKILSAKDTEILSAELKKLDPSKWGGMNESDRKNPRRLVRAIEIARNSNFQFSKFKQIPIFNFQNSKQNTLFIGLTAPNNILYKIIDQRVEERVKEGIEDEIRELLEKGCDWENSALETTLAYREWESYFKKVSRAPQVPRVSQGESREQIIQRWKFDEHEYSRRQMTWFKRDSRINWFDITKEGWREKVDKLVESWYINN